MDPIHLLFFPSKPLDAWATTFFSYWPCSIHTSFYKMLLVRQRTEPTTQQQTHTTNNGSVPLQVHYHNPGTFWGYSWGQFLLGTQLSWAEQCGMGAEHTAAILHLITFQVCPSEIRWTYFQASRDRRAFKPDSFWHLWTSSYELAI